MRRYAIAALGTALLLSGCRPAPRRTQGPGGATAQRCSAPFNAGSRLPGFLNPAYPRTGLFPAPGGFPPGGAAGVVLQVRSKTLVLTYGQALERANVTANNHLITGRVAGAWDTLPVAAGYTFELFGPAVPLFGVVPGPLVTGPRAGMMKDVWLVTQWSATQSITILRGTDALAQSAEEWRQIPPGVSPANLQRAADHIAAAEAAGWTKAGVYPAVAACGASANHLGPFGARASLRLPLGAPLELVSPQYGGTVLRVVAG